MVYTYIVIFFLEFCDVLIQVSLKTGGELRRCGRVSSSCSIGGTRRVNLVTNPVISHECGKDREHIAGHL